MNINEVDVSDFDMESIRSSARNAELVRERIVLAIVLDELGFGSSEIGRFMNKNHATIIHYLKKGEKTKRVKKNMLNTLVQSRLDDINESICKLNEERKALNYLLSSQTEETQPVE